LAGAAAACFPAALRDAAPAVWPEPALRALAQRNPACNSSHLATSARFGRERRLTAMNCTAAG